MKYFLALLTLTLAALSGCVGERPGGDRPGTASSIPADFCGFEQPDPAKLEMAERILGALNGDAERAGFKINDAEFQWTKTDLKYFIARPHPEAWARRIIRDNYDRMEEWTEFTYEEVDNFADCDIVIHHVEEGHVRYWARASFPPWREGRKASVYMNLSASAIRYWPWAYQRTNLHENGHNGGCEHPPKRTWLERISIMNPGFGTFVGDMRDLATCIAELHGWN